MSSDSELFEDPTSVDSTFSSTAVIFVAVGCITGFFIGILVAVGLTVGFPTGLEVLKDSDVPLQPLITNNAETSSKAAASVYLIR